MSNVRNDYRYSYGMITPDGKFWGCRYEGHYDLAMELMEKYSDLTGTIIINTAGALIEGHCDETFMFVDKERFRQDENILLTELQVKTCNAIIKSKSAHEPLKKGAEDALRHQKFWLDLGHTKLKKPGR